MSSDACSHQDDLGMMQCGFSRLAIAIVLIFSVSLLLAPRAAPQSPREVLLTTDNAYNPVPSPDGRYIAYVRTGWGENGFVSLGRTSLISEIRLMNTQGDLTPRILAKDYFLSGWTPDSTRVVCYRDWRYALVSTEGRQEQTGRIPNEPDEEWVAYSPSLATVVWSSRVANSNRAIETPNRTIVRENTFLKERVVPSPDGNYLAVFGDFSPTDLRIYDLRSNAWTDLGAISIHPDKDWSYIQPDWTPWIADGSRLVFLRDSTLVIASPDGKAKTEIQIEGFAGLPTMSPDGQSIAYVTFEPRSRRARPDLQFWGSTIIWVVRAVAGSRPQAVTEKNADEVFDLKWLNHDALVFDRIADEVQYRHARIWKISLN